MSARTITDQQILEAYEQCKGIVVNVAARLKVSRRTIHRRLSKSKKLQEACAEITEANIDRAESKLFDLINDGDRRAITYYLDRKARHRGYGKVVENHNVNTEPVQIYLPENNR
jgi:hypothetical protein